MPVTTQSYRYQLPKKAIKGDCPQCGPRHRKTLSRYMDTKTGEALPETYGRCDRESNCGYHVSPYHKTASNFSYADEQNPSRHETAPLPKAWFRMAGKQKRNHIHRSSVVQCLIEMQGATVDQAERVVKYVFEKPTQTTLHTQARPVCPIPDDLFRQSLGHYKQNQLARLLIKQFGKNKANELLQRFHIGTSARWPGACVFWYIDVQGHKRGGQIKLFGDDWHTAKYVDHEGKKRSKTSWVHSALTYRLEKAGTPLPDWLVEYNEKGECSPCLFGLPQLLDAPIDTPVAIVEAPKTAIVCTHYLPDFIWLAVGALSYLNADRLAPLRGRKIMLFPDLNGFDDWSHRARLLKTKGFQVEVSDYLEQVASDEQKQKGLDLADFLLVPDATRPRWIRDGQVIYGEVLECETCHTYPTDWDI